MPEIDSQELSEYLKAIVKGVEEGLKDSSYHIDAEDTITVELAVINSKRAEGGLKIYVANAGGHFNKEQISKIKIPIRRKIDASIEYV